MSKRRPDDSPPPSTPPRAAKHEILLLTATVAVLALALIQCLVPIFPDIYWDLSPQPGQEPDPVTVFGPLSAAWLNTLCVLAAAGALAAHVAARGRVAWWTLALAAAGTLVCIYHAPHLAEFLHRGGTWVAGVALAVAGFHLARHDRPRRLIAAALVAMLIPLAIRTVLFMRVEQPMTVELFKEREATFLQGQGWLQGSPQHLAYLRRLESAEMTGAFGLSNVFASVAGAITLLAAGWIVVLLRQRRWSLAAGLAAPCAAGLYCVAMTHSKGGAAALLGTACLIPVAVWCLRGGTRRFWLSAAAIALVAAAVAAVLIRGQLGPPSSAGGERSVLFRYQYWVGAARVLAEAPQRILVGVGPGGFQDLYAKVKDPRNPEEVTSTHSVFVDLVAMLGVGGLAWSALLLAWLVRGGVPPPEDEPPPAAPWSELDPANALAGAALALVVFVPYFVVKLAEFADPVGAITWLLCVGAFAVGVTVLSNRVWSTPRALWLGLFLAAALLLVHNQIEMTFYHQGAAAIAYLIVGVAGGAAMKPRPTDSPPRAAWLAPTLFLLLSAAMLVGYVLPVARQQDALRRAAWAVQSSDPPPDILAARKYLDEAIAALPSDPRPVQHRAELLLNMAHGVARHGGPRAAQPFIDEALTLPAALTPRAREQLGLLRTLAQVREHAATILNEPRYLSDAAAAWRDIADRSPYGLQDHLRLANLLWRLDRRDDAAAEYRRVLEINELSYLDPVRQLPEDERLATIKQRAAVAETRPK